LKTRQKQGSTRAESEGSIIRAIIESRDSLRDGDKRQEIKNETRSSGKGNDASVNVETW